MATDIVVDTVTARLYNAPADPRFVDFFRWLRSDGVLGLSQALLAEYHGTGNRLLIALVSELVREKRIVFVKTKRLKAFAKRDRHRYHCNFKDEWHARLVFLTARKKLVSGDKNLVRSVNEHPKVGRIKPVAVLIPVAPF